MKKKMRTLSGFRFVIDERDKKLDEVIEMVERKEMEKFDVTRYVGENSEIVIAEIRDMKFGKVLYLQSKDIPFKEGDSLPDGKKLTASRILGFQKNASGEYYIGIDSALDKFMTSKKVKPQDISSLESGTRIKAFEGMKVKVQKTDNGFLEIA